MEAVAKIKQQLNGWKIVIAGIESDYTVVELNEFQKSLTGDEDATYMKTITYRAEDFVPVIDVYKRQVYSSLWCLPSGNDGVL